MGDPGTRAVVATASYEARKFGVHSAMPLGEARRLCPTAVIVPVRHRIYEEHSQRVMNLLREYAAQHESVPQVEQVSIDEAYAEIEAERDATEIAHELQHRIQTELGLDCTSAVATNKLVSKIACNTVKPRGFIVVRAGEEQTFLAPLPVGMIPGAGKVTRVKLLRWNVTTIGDLANVPVEELRAQFGKLGIYLHDAAHGRDDSPIVSDAKPKSFSQEITLNRDTRSATELEKYLVEMSEILGRELSRREYAARTIVLKLRFADFTTITRQTTLRTPTADGKLIVEHGRNLLRAHWDQERPVRLIGIGAHNLVEPDSPAQLELRLE